MIRTRFAPSPTGYLHIGGVRTALFNWLFARRHGGKFLLRIDDTDQQRNLQEALAPILEGFRWLGIDWDEGPEVGGPHAPYFQSQRTQRYQQAVAQLLTSGAAYEDFATAQEVQAEREAAEREKQPFVYSRRYAAWTEEDRQRYLAEGREAVVRLKMPREGTLEINDLIRGAVRFEWQHEQDHVIRRADGTCLYHLATVIDDHDFEITHVIRAEEHLSNTPRQVFIFQQLGYAVPEFAHIPFVAEPGSRNKLSKRKLDKYLKHRDFKLLNDLGQRVAERLQWTTAQDTFNPVIVDFYRQIGFLPEAIINYLLLLGWSLDDKTEDFTREAMIEHFSLERVTKAPASFDPQKLLAFQDRYMQRLSIEEKVAQVTPFLQQAGWASEPWDAETARYVERIVEAAGDRLKLASDILEYPEFFVDDESFHYNDADFDKRLLKAEETLGLLQQYRMQLETVQPFEAAELERNLKAFVDQQQIKIGQIIHALRVAVTGKAVGFGMFETLEILGRQRCLKRLDRSLARAQAKR